MIRAMVLIGAILLSTGAHADDELQFTEHGFSIQLADNWVVSDISPFYEKYLSTNKEAFGDEAGKRIGQETNFLFKANRGTLSDDEAMFFCAVARSTEQLGELTVEQQNLLMEKAAFGSYNALVSRGMEVTRPSSRSRNGIEYWTHRMSQRDGEHLSEYKVFFVDKGLVICAGGALSSYSKEVTFMHDSIAATHAREAP